MNEVKIKSQKAADRMRAAYWVIILGAVAVLVAYLIFGPTPLNDKAIAWIVMGIIGGSFILPYSAYWYISRRVR